MSTFITTKEVVNSGLDHYFFLSCTDEDLNPSEHIYGSHTFAQPSSLKDYINSIRSINLPENLTIICYDCVNYTHASKAYWGLTSVGFTCKVLVLSPSLEPSIVILSGAAPSITFDKTLIRELNPNVFMTKKQYEENNKRLRQIVINYLTFNIVDHNGKLIGKNKAKEFLACSGLVVPNERAVVYGKKAFLGALVLKYIGKDDIGVIGDEVDRVGMRSEIKSNNFTVKSTEDEELMLKYSHTLSNSDMSNVAKQPTANITEEKNCMKCDVF